MLKLIDLSNRNSSRIKKKLWEDLLGFASTFRMTTKIVYQLVLLFNFH